MGGCRVGWGGRGVEGGGGRIPFSSEGSEMSDWVGDLLTLRGLTRGEGR